MQYKIWRVEFNSGLFRGNYSYEFVVGETKEQAQSVANKLFGTLYKPQVTKEVKTSKQGTQVTRFGDFAYFSNEEKIAFEFDLED